MHFLKYCGGFHSFRIPHMALACAVTGVPSSGGGSHYNKPPGENRHATMRLAGQYWMLADGVRVKVKVGPLEVFVLVIWQ